MCQEAYTKEKLKGKGKGCKKGGDTETRKTAKEMGIQRY